MDMCRIVLCFTCLIWIGNVSAVYTRRGRVRFSRRQRSRDVPSNIKAPHTGQQLRLSHVEGETGIGKGRVGVFIRDNFGAICDNSWDIRDADVVCKQMGFLRGGVTTRIGGSLGRGSRYVMDNVNCDEHAQSIVECDWETPEECGQRQAAGVECRPNKGCPDGWIAGPTGCYQILPNPVTKREFAINKCAARGGHLINIETEEENHFTSHAFWNESLGPILTGGVKVGGNWMWEKVSKETKGRDVETTTQMPIEEFKWFPGWQPGSYLAEPTGKKKERCLFLSNIFQHPNGSDVSVGYHFWLDERCSSTRKRLSSGFRAICERPPEWKDVGCYRGIGTEYRGTASLTSKGTPCMKWTEAADINPVTYPETGLGDHNYCRNPDNDEAPWCWISDGNFEFCNIPKCTEEHEDMESETIGDTWTETNNDISGVTSDDVETDTNDNAETETSAHAETETSNHAETEINDIAESETSDHAETETSTHAETETSDHAETVMSDHAGTETSDHAETETNDNAGIAMSDHAGTAMSDNAGTAMSDHAGTAMSDDVNAETSDHAETETSAHAETKTSDDTETAMSDHAGTTMSDDVNAETSDHAEIETSDHAETETNNDNTESSEVNNTVPSDIDTETSDNSETQSNSKEDIMCDTDEFRCEDRCIPGNWKCDMEHDCNSGKDESLSCDHCEGMFRCNNSRCLPEDYVCDGVDHCDDFTDEADCGKEAPVAVKLMGGTEMAGRVEVFYKGEWGIICDDKWDETDAAVVCNMLGFTGPTEALVRSYYGNGVGNILMDEVECKGTETNIDQCEHNGWKNHDCYIWEAAAVKCSEKEAPVCSVTKEFFCKDDAKCISLNEVCDGKCQCTSCADEHDCDSKVTLVGGDTPSEGRVEIVLNGILGTICDDYFGDEDAIVICRMLGYSWGTSVKEALFGSGNGTIWMDDVKCIGNETDIITCSHFGPRDHNCGHDEDVGVICQTANEAITVRLEDGSESSGRVVLTRNNEEGTICDDSWDDEDATVICRMLGFRDGKALMGEFYGAGDLNRHIFLDDVQCRGDEKSIELCSHSDWLVHNCKHSEDAGVTCRQYDDDHDDHKTLTTSTSTTKQPQATTGEPSDCHNPDIPYIGRRAVTENGFECQAWDSNTPHRHKHHTDSAFPDGSVRAARNYCRSPDGDSVPWCYTTHPDERWGYCNIPKCKVNCFSIASEYTGPTSQTTSGHMCQRWSSSTPHNHKYDSDNNFPDGSVEAAANNCRSPDGDVTPWCYTSNADVRWEYCDISRCAGGFDFNSNCGLRPLENGRDRRDVREDLYDEDFLLYRKMGRIYGGSKASYGMYPWQAGIRRRLSGFLGYHLHHCGGTIIGEYWILTAAHCFRDASKGQVIVRTGDLNSGHRDKYEQEFDIEAIIQHERYDSQDYDYDIALLKLQPIHGRGIVFNDYVQPACLPNKTTEYRPGYKCLISGWGEYEDDSRSEHMKAARVPIVDQRTCNRLYKQTITSNMACAGYLAGGVDTCAGDSGGPLVCKINNKYTVMGVVSFGEGCAVPNAPGVYARVSAFVPWIKEKLSLYS